MMPGKPVARSKTQDVSTMQGWLSGILDAVKTGGLSVNDAVKELSVLPYEEMGFAKIDHHRHLRTGFPEVVLGKGKSAAQIAAIAERLAARSERILITRASRAAYLAVKKISSNASYNPDAMTIVINSGKLRKLKSGIAVVCGGTADISVAEEAAVTAELMGNKVDRIYDIGVAGIHRLLDKVPQLKLARVVVAVAGMEGALPGVVGGLLGVPVIAVPTSVGYGASFDGLAPLLTMLNSCAPGIAVVNIDNGFGAGYMAGLINLRSVR